MESLQKNTFSTINAQILPVAIAPLLHSALHLEDELLEEALSFAICASNLDLVWEILKKLEKEKKGISCIYPFHLATSYVDGSKSCCLILDCLADFAKERHRLLKDRHLNELGHNPFENLMITVLRSHTSLSPGAIDPRLRQEKRFPGEEVDVCGRWNADSECYRQLLASGRSTIPLEWKHKFCHTSTQTVCHMIEALSGVPYSIGTTELFSRRCEHCGLKMELTSLHVAVLVVYYLAEYGCKGEDLFGALAIILSLIYQASWDGDFKWFSAAEYLPLSMLLMEH